MGKIKKPTQKEIKALKIELPNLMTRFSIKPTVALSKIEKAIFSIKNRQENTIAKLPSDVRASLRFMKKDVKRFHGAKASLAWFPWRFRFSRCRNRFGYMVNGNFRNSTKLGFNAVNIALLNALGNLMGNSGRENSIPDSTIPAGYTYFGQFVDHDVTLDITSSIDSATNANTINNMRTPALDLDSVYGNGPALNPFLYEFPSTNPQTAIKLKLGTNRNTGPGGPGGVAGGGGMQVQTDFDIPRIPGTNTAVIGDPRNDENLIVSQFHHTMLKFHNKVVDLLILGSFAGDIFVEAKKIVTHHYQWAVVNDFLNRICGSAAVNNALTNVNAPINSSFRMPVEFAVGAYRFGHSLIRDSYWLNFNFINQPLSDVFSFARNPNLPVLSNWIVDFNAFFNTGIPVPVFNHARKIDSVLSNGLETLPGGAGIMAMLATRNLRRGLALGLPSGQGAAQAFGIAPLTAVQLTSGLPPDEVTLLNSNGGTLLNKTPLWYYVLREAAVISNGEHLGPLGAKIVADTFVRMLKRDANSYLNEVGGFVPFLPSNATGEFNVEDLIIFSGVNQP